MSVKSGAGVVERDNQKRDPYVWHRVMGRFRVDGRESGMTEQVSARIHDRVAEVFSRADAMRMLELTRLSMLGPDPDEDLTEDSSALRFPCEACGQREGFKPTMGRIPPNPARLCPECRADGFRSSRCDCGKPLHHRDYASNSKRGRIMGTRCGECRRKLRDEFGYSHGVRVA